MNSAANEQTLSQLLPVKAEVMMAEVRTRDTLPHLRVGGGASVAEIRASAAVRHWHGPTKGEQWNLLVSGGMVLHRPGE